MSIEFRTLRAEEIDVRVGSINPDKGISLLLYKDARCDMNILDETVGPERWERNHEVINGNLFCTVSIQIKPDDDWAPWIKKQDVGVKSYSQEEKGEASDSFKRACVNWGIGRELYTSPFIWVDKSACTISKNDKNQYEVKDNFKVVDIVYTDDRKINKLKIKNTKTKKICYTYGFGTFKPTEENNIKMSTKEQKSIVSRAVREDLMKDTEVIRAIETFDKSEFLELTYEEAKSIVDTAEKRLEAKKKDEKDDK